MSEQQKDRWQILMDMLNKQMEELMSQRNLILIQDRQIRYLHTLVTQLLETMPQKKKRETGQPKFVPENCRNVINYLNEKAGTSYRPVSENIRLINGLYDKGYKFDQFKKVIDKKCKDWIGTEQEKYLRPATLFGNKFDQYLNQPEPKILTKKEERVERFRDSIK